MLERLPSLADSAPLPSESTGHVVERILETARVGEDDARLPESVRDRECASFDYPGWTAGLVRQVLAAVAPIADWRVLADEPITDPSPERLLVEATTSQRGVVSMLADDVKRMKRELRALRHARLMAEGAVLERVVRYEAHLGAQLESTLRALWEAQARRGAPPPSSHGGRQAVAPPAEPRQQRPRMVSVESVAGGARDGLLRVVGQDGVARLPTWLTVIQSEPAV